MSPLFEQYPLLRERLAYTPLAELPTPVQKLDRLGADLGIDELYVKRDDISGKVYGGNKPRKLEFLLGEALQSGATHVMTFGGAGSNHALATAIYAKQLGLKSISMLMPQPNATCVRRNLLMSHVYGAELHLSGAGLESAWHVPLIYAATTVQMVRHRLVDGSLPWRIPPGGSSPLGVVGFVNAAFELRNQVEAGVLPAPDYIYVACGTLGTAAGLILGLRAAKLRTRVVAVKITGGHYVEAGRVVEFIHGTCSLLHSLDASFPNPEFSPAEIDIRSDYFGTKYGLFTGEGMEAVSLAKEREGITLDGTYTGKTLAALIGDARDGRLRGQSVLFWNTLNSRDFSDAISGVDYHDLPRSFHRYFEEPVQPLDRE